VQFEYFTKGMKKAFAMRFPHNKSIFCLAQKEGFERPLLALTMRVNGRFSV